MGGQIILYEPRGAGSQRCVAGKKTRGFISIYQIHISRTPPSVDSVPASLVRRRSSMDRHSFQLGSLSWRDSDSMPISLFREPLRYGWWSEQRNIVG